MLPSDVKYTFHGVPKPPACAASLMPGLARKLYALAITAPSNVAFGGPKHDQLFVTGGLGPEAGKGGLFRLDLNTKGLVILPAKK